METEFTPWLSLGGGFLIGLAASLLMYFRGRVFGATGILSGFIVPESADDWAWRGVVIAGMISGPLAVLAITGQMPLVQIPISTAAIIIGGVIVGIGVTFGNGCTSGHGVCGIARFSPRSVVATVVCMAASFVTVYVIRHVIGGI